MCIVNTHESYLHTDLIILKYARADFPGLVMGDTMNVGLSQLGNYPSPSAKLLPYFNSKAQALSLTSCFLIQNYH